jgi:hypothetical protein
MLAHAIDAIVPAYASSGIAMARPGPAVTVRDVLHVLHTPFVHRPDWQSVPTLHVSLSGHVPHVPPPPQSTSVSLPSFDVSVHDWHARAPLHE